MMRNFWFILSNVATVLCILGVLQLGARKWVRENIVTPLQRNTELTEVSAHQLTKNGGKNKPATVPDVAHEVRALRAEFKLREIKDEQWREEHRAYSDEQIAQVNDRLARLEDRK